jgi:hypothetical protein
MANKRLKFLWLELPVPPDRWEPTKGTMGAAGYDKLTPREKRSADNFSVCDQRNTFMEDAYMRLASAIMFLFKLCVALFLLFILTFGHQLLRTAQEIYGVTNETTAQQSK